MGCHAQPHHNRWEALPACRRPLWARTETMNIPDETALLAKALWSTAIVLGLSAIAERVSVRIAGHRMDIVQTQDRVVKAVRLAPPAAEATKPAATD